MKKFLTPLFYSAAVLLAACGNDKIDIAKNSEAVSPIVVPDNPTKCEEFAAKELKWHLDKMSGGDFKILKESESGNGDGAIYVGNGKTAKKLLGGYDPQKAEVDNIRIKNAGKNLVLAGHEKRGTLYAVYSFLEDCLGVRWWADDDMFVPKKASISAENLDVDYSPKLTYRRVDYKVGSDPLLSARLKSGILKMPDMELRKEIDDTFAIWCHSFYQIIPPQKYFKDHPEWFSEIDGKRDFQHRQLCLTNDEMTKEAVKNVLEKLRRQPSARFVHVSQNDWHGQCECAKCRAFEDAHGGAHSATIVNFANKIAEGIEKEFPHVNVVTFAYQYSRPAPKGIAPRKNVWIELCSIECDFAHPLESDKDFGFTNDIVEWGKLTNNLTIWDYVTCFKNYAIPYPNYGVLAPNIRFFTKHGAVGLFEQSDQTNVAGDFVRFRNWYLYHLMWNDNVDERKLARDFLDGYYAPEVGGFLQEYLEILAARANAVNYAQVCYYVDTMTWLDAKTYNKAAELMEKALKKAEKLAKKDPAKYAGLLRKIRREKISIDYVGVVNYARLFRKSQEEGVEMKYPADPVATAKDIVSRWKEFNVHRINQHEKRENFLRFMDTLVASAKSQLDYIGKFPQRVDSPPPDPSRFKAGTYVEFQEERIGQENPQRGVTAHSAVFVYDKNASNKCALTLEKGCEQHRRFEVYLRDDLAKLKSASGNPASKKFRIYGYVRTAEAHPKNAHMRLHIYDKSAGGKIHYDKDVKLDGLNGEKFTEIDFGTFEMPEPDITKKPATIYLMWLRILGTKRFDDIILDRFVVVRE